MKKNLYLILFAVLLSCGRNNANNHVEEGTVEENIYTSNDLGWTITIPAGWEVVNTDKIDENEQKGKEALEKSTGLDLDLSQLQHLISFKKSQFNFLASTSEPFIEDYPGEYDENSKYLNKIIFDTYKDQGIPADTATGIFIIDGLEFKTLKTVIYGMDGEVLLNQVMYSRLINGFDFGININYNNPDDRHEMVKAIKGSTFERND